MFSKGRNHHQRNRLIMGACSSCLLFLAFFSLNYCHESEANKAKETRSSSISFASLEGLSLEEKVDNEISFSINAEKAHVKNRKAGFFRVAFQKVVEMENVTVRSRNNATDTGLMEIRSERATMYLGSKDILFKGNVTFSSQDGRTLKTGELMWDKKRNRFKTESEYVYMTSDGAVHRGTGFESDGALKAINFKNTDKSLSRGEKSNHG